MPLNITVTKRELKNKESGVDMSVNSYEPASTPKLVKNYRVVVITNLPFFKLPEHGENDVVQFMILRDYDAFDKLQKEITQDFPNLKLPTLPRKFHLFMNNTDIEERQVAFDCLLKVLAKDKRKCVSRPILEFLGFDLLADKNYFKRRKEFLQKQEEERRREKSAEVQLPEASLFRAVPVGEASDDLFGDTQTKSTTKAYTGGSIFDDGSTTGGPKKTAKVSLLDDDDLFLTGDAQTTTDATLKGDGDKSIFETEDNSDILEVSDSLDDVLKIVNKPVKEKTVVKKVTPDKSTSSGGGLFDVDPTDSKGITSMDTDDITKYIQQNQTVEDDFDLF